MTTTALLMRLAISVVAFNAANQSERPLARAIGLAVLTGSGILLTISAFGGAGIFAWILGPLILAAAAFAYWSNR